MTDACECSAVNAPGETQYPLSKALFQKYDRGNSHYAVGNPPGVIPTLTKVVRSHALLRVGTALTPIFARNIIIPPCCNRLIRSADGVLMEKHRIATFILAFALWALATSPTALGQSVSGQISGTVTDPAGAVIAGVEVVLTNNLTKQARKFITESSGSFVFTNLVTGDYSIHIATPGFKAYDQKGINVSAQERVDLHDIRLPVGDVSTTVEVQSEVARVATDSSDRGILVNTTMIENTPTQGRDYLGILRALPGVQAVDTNDKPGWNQSAPGINGGNSGQVLITLDGVGSQNSGFGASNTAAYLSPNIEAISEVKVLVSNYQAEYGARSGGQMNVTVKNGTDQFHGSAYWYWRHESLNANAWFNNKNGLTRPRYRYQNPGLTFGGPLIIPGTNFNKSRTKLFFFFSEDFLHTTQTGGVSSYNMPTALERGGDFSQTFTTTGALIPIKDPASGLSYPGNRMPASQISPTGLAMLNLFPLPNATDPTGRRQYNAQYQFNRDQPHEDRILRADYNIGVRDTSFVRLIQDYEADRGVGALLGGGGGWGQFKSSWNLQSAGLVATEIHTFRPNLINEFTFGVNTSTHFAAPLDKAEFAAGNELSSLKGANGQPIALTHFFSGNYLNILPNINFGVNGAQSAGQAVTAPPGFSFDSRWPLEGADTLWNVVDNVTLVKGAHNTKFGFYYEHVKRPISVYSTYNAAGTYWLGSDIANPNDTGFAYSNLLRGTIQAYGEDNKKQINHAGYNQWEWFAQDTWKVSRRVTIDAGLRFQIIQPAYSRGATLGLFDGKSYSSTKSGQLLFPALVDGQRVAINPQTGASYQFARATSFDPASYPPNGSPYSGIVQYNSKFFHTPPVLFAPRLGFAWDVFGDGKTAMRGGIGIFYGRPYGVDTIGATGSGIGPMAAPPAFLAPIYYNTTFSSLLNTQGFFGAQSVNGGSQDYKNPTSYQWSFGIQQNLGHGMILDAAYVANVAHHGFGTTNDANAVAPLTTWTPAGGPDGTKNPKFLDPTSAGGGTGAFYPTNLIRALTGYHGYAAISTFTSKGESYYNSLQVQVNRRFGRSFQFATNYTWAKLITYTPQQWAPDYITKNVSGRPHAVNVTFGYAIPDGSRLLGKNAVTSALIDGWHLNGVGTFFSGTPLTIGCAAQSAVIGWPNGTPTGGIPLRCQMNGDLWLASGATPPSTTESRLWYPFRAATFSLPPGSTLGLGNTPPTLTYGPGFESADLSVYKQFRLGKESRVLIFRAESFNALNHFNPGNPNTSLTLNYATGANTNANFGSITGVQGRARRMAFSLKLRF